MLSKEGTDFKECENGMLYFREQIYVPDIGQLRKQILDKTHKSKYAIHLGEVKMYKDLKRVYWWAGMKKDVTNYVSTYLNCQKVKAEHKKVVGLLQPLLVPEWKWEEVTMDFVTGLRLTQNKKDAIRVVVDRLTKIAHFIPVKCKRFHGKAGKDLYSGSGQIRRGTLEYCVRSGPEIYLKGLEEVPRVDRNDSEI
jgi:hypothetical protein